MASNLSNRTLGNIDSKKGNQIEAGNAITKIINKFFYKFHVGNNSEKLFDLKNVYEPFARIK